jgi:hypothetical protein
MKLAFYRSQTNIVHYCRKPIVFFTFLFFITVSAQAATVTSTTSGNWNAGSTWVGGVAPSSTDDVVIASGTTVTVTADATARSLVVYGTIVENTGLTFTINGDADVMSTGKLYLSGNTSCNGSASNFLLVYGNYTNYGQSCFYKSTVIITGDLASPSASALQNNGNIVVGGNLSGSIDLTGGTGTSQVYVLNPNATVSLSPAISTSTDVTGESTALVSLVNTVIYGSSCGFAINGNLNVNTCPGGSASFVITSTTATSPTYQWYENQGLGWVSLSNGGVYSGVTTATLTISNATGKDTYIYRCGITDNAACTRYSYAGTLTTSAPANTAGAASSTPTLCSNTTLTNITHATTGATGIGTATGLPAGVTAAWASNTITISGTPTAGGTFNYSIPLTGGCGSVSATGSITVNATNNWTGAVSTDWSNLSNWTCRVPTAADDVVISATTNQPVLGTSANVKNVTINSGAVLTLNSTSVLNVYGNWTNNGNTASFVHGNNEVVFIGAGTHTITGTSNFYNVSTNNTSGAVTLNLNGSTGVAGTLKMTGSTVNTNSNLTLLSTSDTQAGSIGDLTGATLNGNVTAQRYMSAIGNTFRYVASPLTSVLPPATWGSKIYEYNYVGVAGSWVWHSPTSPITRGQGFTISLNMTTPITWEVNGTVGSGSHTWTFGEAGWHLIGNPFPSPIEWSTNNNLAWVGTNISATIGITDNSVSGYPNYFRYYNPVGTIPSSWGSGVIQNGIIAMGQAFWIYVGTGGGSLTVYEPAKNSTATSKFYRARTEENHAIGVMMSDGKAYDVAYLDQQADATNRFDINQDVMKFNNEGLNIYFLDQDQNKLMKQSISEIDDQLIPLGVEVLADGLYEIAFQEPDNFGVPLYWIDTYEQKSILMGHEPFKVELKAGAARDRFYISTKKDMPGLSTLKLFPNPVNDILHIELAGSGHFTLLNGQGQLVQVGDVRNQFSLNMDQLPPGMYMLKVATGTEMVTKKIIKQ